jgi:hypothetical protein
LALDDVLDAAADPDDWQPRTFVLKRGTVVLTLPEGVNSCSTVNNTPRATFKAAVEAATPETTAGLTR